MQVSSSSSYNDNKRTAVGGTNEIEAFCHTCEMTDEIGVAKHDVYRLRHCQMIGDSHARLNKGHVQLVVLFNSIWREQEVPDA